MLRAPILLGFVLLLLLNAGYGCSCIGFGPACTEVVSPGTSAVFLGKVVSLTPSKPVHMKARKDPEEFDVEINMVDVRLSVEETYKGVSTSEVVVNTASDEAACGFPFKKGERYVVYASENQGKLYTSICQRTLPLKFAEKDLEYLRHFKDAPPTGSIFGSYKRYTFDPAFKPKFEPSIMDHYRPPEEEYRAMAPMTGETVTLTAADGIQQQAKINSEGGFLFSGLAPGKYKIAVTPPAGLARAYGYAAGMSPFGVDELSIPSKGCAEVTYRTEPDGHISGRIVNQDGAPLPNVSVSFWKAAEKFNIYASAYVNNNDDGTFDLGPLPPGEYKLAAHVWLLPQGYPGEPDREKLTNATLRFFPGATSPDAATLIKVGFGEHVSGIEIKIPFDPAQWKDVKASQ
jgi:hypothetical protein